MASDRTGQSLALQRLRWWADLSEAYPRATDLLDAGCEPGLQLGPRVEDDDLPWLILFADVDWTDADALRDRAAEWRDLFGG